MIETRLLNQMTKTLAQLMALALLLMASFTGLSQLAPQQYEVDVTVHYGAGSDGVDLTGYVTYDVYLVTATPITRIVLISGNTPDLEALADTLGEDGILTPDAGDLFINTPCGTFQHENSGWNVAQNNCNLQSFLPSMAWDSFITLKYLCSPTPTAINNLVGFVQDVNALAAWENDNTNNFFDGGTSLVIDNGALFGLPTDVSTLPVNNRLLVMRITTCGDLEACFNADVYANYTPGGAPPVTERVCVEATHPCLTNPMDTSPAVANVNCFGDATQVSLSGGGNGPTDYQLFSGATLGTGALVSTQTDVDGTVDFTGMPAGTYYITMIDSVGCRDTSSVFQVSVPEQLVLNATLLTDVLCFGENTGSIEVTCSGGTAPTSITLNGGGITCGQTISNLGCGNYNIVLTDNNGCSQQSTLSVACPTQIVGDLTAANVTCFGYNDGSIEGSISGGTGVKNISLLLNGGEVQTQSGAGVVNISWTLLAPGIYTVNVEDANGCTWSQEFVITEPGLFTVSATVTPVTCFGVCDGTVATVVQGGSGLASTQVVPQTGGNPVNALALCAGDYTVNVTDDNGCIASDDFTVDGPDDITYIQSSANVTCFALNDGTIQLTEVAGGSGGYTYTLIPALALCNAPCSGSNVDFLNVPAGNYTVRITDQAGCEKNVSGIVITEPAPINIQTAVINVTCFGLNNGLVNVSGTGGTGQLVLVNTGDNLPSQVSDLSPANYTFQVTDENNCIAEQNVVITEPELLTATVDATNDVSCGGACDGSVEYTIQGGTGPYGFFFNPEGTPAAADGDVDDLCADDYSVTIYDLNNCETTIDFSISEPAPLVIDVALLRPSCTGMFNGSANITVSGGTGSLETFFAPASLDLTENSPTSFSITGLGEETFFIDLIDSLGCSLRDTVEVTPVIITDMVLTMFSSPETCFNTKDGTATCAVQNGNLPITYSWNDPETQVSPTAVGLAGNQQYTVVVKDAIGCTLVGRVFVEPSPGCFFVANVVTPNGDGVNDTWVLGGLELYPSAKIKVFNRWGQTVYESTGYSSPWTGTNDGELLPMADYYYIIDYSDEFEPITGTVTIKY